MELRHKALSESIIGAAIEVHKAMGPGLLESIYEECLVMELKLRGHTLVQQKAIPLWYKGFNLSGNYRLDLLVDDTVILEIKTVEKILPVHEAQLLAYLRLAEKNLGFVMNFNVRHMKDGIKRMVL